MEGLELILSLELSLAGSSRGYLEELRFISVIYRGLLGVVVLARLLSKYRFMVEALGLRQLDVYRVREGGREVDILRVYDPSTRKVVVVNLGALRESLDPREFLDRLLKSLEKAGVRVSDKKLSKILSQG